MTMYRTIAASVLIGAAAVAVPAMTDPALLTPFAPDDAMVDRPFDPSDTWVSRGNPTRPTNAPAAAIAAALIRTTGLRQHPGQADAADRASAISAVSALGADERSLAFANDLFEPMPVPGFALASLVPTNAGTSDRLGARHAPDAFADAVPGLDGRSAPATGSDAIGYGSDFLRLESRIARKTALVAQRFAMPAPVRPAAATTASASLIVPIPGDGNLLSPKLAATAVPEPEMWLLGASGFGLVGLQLRRRATAVMLVTA